MIKRGLYRLELEEDAVIVYRTDGYGRQGVIFKDGSLRYEYTPRRIPKYVYNEAQTILHASEFELERGYTISGKPCRIG